MMFETEPFFRYAFDMAGVTIMAATNIRGIEGKIQEWERSALRKRRTAEKSFLTSQRSLRNGPFCAQTFLIRRRIDLLHFFGEFCTSQFDLSTRSVFHCFEIGFAHRLVGSPFGSRMVLRFVRAPCLTARCPWATSSGPRPGVH
jgi:hypothetical protein